jgi:hypothetical protein
VNTGLGLPAGQDGLFQLLLAAHDPHLAVIHLDAVEERPQVGLAEGDLAGCEILAHGPREALDNNWADVMFSTARVPDLARSSACAGSSPSSA